MKNKREIHSATSTNPYCRGGLLLLHHGGGGDGVGGDGDLSGRAPPEFSPSNLLPPASVFWFLSWRLSRNEERRGLFIGAVLGQDEASRRRPKPAEPRGPGWWVPHGQRGGRVGPPLCGLRTPFPPLLRSEVFLLPKK